MYHNYFSYSHKIIVWLSLLLAWWLQITTGSVYNVKPEDHYYPNTTCHHCHNLQHYLLNTTKYFTANTQLLFLPGIHHLHTDLTVQNLHNISLIGSTTNGTTPDTVIQCNSSVGIVMTNVTNFIVTNITVRSCLGNEYNNATVLIKQCTNVQLRHVVIEESHNSYGIVGINILGDSRFSYITNNAMRVIYNETTVDMVNHSLSIDHYYINAVDENFQCKVTFKLYQNTYRVAVAFQNSKFQWLRNETAFCAEFNNEGIGHNVVMVNNCKFSNNQVCSIFLKIKDGYRKQQGDAVLIENCQFFEHYTKLHITDNREIIEVVNGPNVYLSHCTFYDNKYFLALRKQSPHLVALLPPQSSKVVITNTTFLSSKLLYRHDGFLKFYMADLHLIGPVIFHNITACNILKLKQTNLTCSNYIEFSKIEADALFRYIYYDFSNYTYFNMFIEQNTIVNVSCNNFSTFVSRSLDTVLKSDAIWNYMYPPCYFQYLGNALLDNDTKNSSYSVIFDRNYGKPGAKFAYKDLPLVHCSWLPQSAFNTAMPLEVNKKYIKYINKSGTFDMVPQYARQKTLCYCDNTNHYDCEKELLDPIYPGQTVTLTLYAKTVGLLALNTVITVVDNINWLSPAGCVITNFSKMVQISERHTCTATKYTIAFQKEGYKWCELFLKGSHDGANKIDIYSITELPCPAGFIKINGICQCYPFLEQWDIKCNINDRTILRHANTWISVPYNNTYSFSISLHCPFHYCLPNSSHLSFSTPNSQCQFNRSDILCGHCQQGLSTVFGSSHCHQCSNIYLFLIVPIAIAGLVLVLLLFILNLTVTDGTINAFILYVNIISINSSIFFPKVDEVKPAYIFISLANLDLGFQACFYNGMDDYAKMWLQLAFPFYLIFIATSLIITSRYSTTIQRLTARRALSVLATLFLLSYTKILHITSSVLFSYSKLIHLPSGHTNLVWSIDANISLFRIQFTILFIVCLILFLILLLFNLIFLFTRSLSRFHLITKFKPLLDAYQGPYKIKFYYWTGVQLAIRLVFYGMSSLDRNINLTIGIMLLTIIVGLEGVLRPFKINYKNYQMLIFMFNLQSLFVILLYNQCGAHYVDIMITLAAAHLFVIVVHHLSYYACRRTMTNKIISNILKVTGWLTNVRNRKYVQQLELQEVPLHNIPEVAFNYCEYQEPLIRVD